MNNKEEFKKIKELTETICKSCKTYEETIEALKPYLTRITDTSSPRIEEFNEKYSILEMIDCKEKKGIIHDYEDKTKLIIDYYLYDKAPYGVAIVLNQMELWKDNWLQKAIAIYIKEN